MPIILGIDPGSRITGFGIIQSDGQYSEYITSGCIKLTDKTFPARLQQLFTGLSQIIQTHQPQDAAIEQVFMHNNANSALKLGQARGAAITAVVTHNLPLAEYAARQVKQAVVGHGAADKAQVQHMVKTILKLTGDIQIDASDALAIALCHAHTMHRRHK